mmetsp:Transcript_7191/g.13332  ORF Transcript_7191/g.13332 Transcript_7191/m.13332 type:complete len:370 (-) Transcript_7191:148-1257(-)
MAHKSDRIDNGANAPEEPPELGGCIGCCMMCCFGCLTCCGCRDAVCRKIMFFPPEPPFYKISDDSKLMRIPLELLPNTEDLSQDDVKRMGQAHFSKRLEVKLVRLKTERRSEIVACHITHPKAKSTVLYSHGNATDIGMQSYAIETLVIACRVNVLFYDYTGYGWSARHDKPAPSHVGADAEAAYTYLVKDAGVPASSIILYGQSLGSVPSCLLAKNHKVKGLVIHSGMASAIRVLKPSIKRSPWFDLFRNVDVIRDAKCPVFIIHGDADKAVPFSNGKALYDNAPMKIRPWWVKGGDHNNIEMDHAREYYQRLIHAFRSFDKVWEAIKKNEVAVEHVHNVQATNDAKTTEDSKSNTGYVITAQPRTSL